MLELRDVEFKVESSDGGELEIIDKISLQIESGKFIVVTGPNGGGKSTLAKLIMGIEKPTSGQILFNGQDITDLPIYERSKLGIGYAFQTPARFKGMTVRKLLSLASGRELPADACSQYLTAVGLCSADYLNREVDSSLSGGEVKRIEIATLMARNLELAIYDEPEAGIDLWSFAKLVESFKTISKRRHKTVLIISHQERIMQLADEIIIVANGKIRKQGAKDEIFPGLLKDLGEENACAFRKESE
ncbi:MAG: ATP-binding cassette domain-containing protein [Clostridiales bacterium]|nr:ATP-binding cassette domain-containing protein [Clostridiales bacterium]